LKGADTGKIAARLGIATGQQLEILHPILPVLTALAQGTDRSRALSLPPARIFLRGFFHAGCYVRSTGPSPAYSLQPQTRRR
jgi:hypothetical protein